MQSLVLVIVAVTMVVRLMGVHAPFSRYSSSSSSSLFLMCHTIVFIATFCCLFAFSKLSTRVWIIIKSYPGFWRVSLRVNVYLFSTFKYALNSILLVNNFPANGFVDARCCLLFCSAFISREIFSVVKTKPSSHINI